MGLFRFPRSILGQWTAGIAIVAMICAPTACTSLPEGNAGDGDDLYGVLINSDSSSSTLGGVRLPSGRSVYLYGSFNEDGSIAEITDVVLRDEQGREASLHFANGRPVKALAFDGSTVDITYTEVSDQRLAGQVEIFFAGAGQTQSFDFDVDLQTAAAQLAQVVKDLTGLDVSTAEPPADVGEIDASMAKAASDGDPVKPSMNNHLPFVVGVAFVFVVVTGGYVLFSIMTQAMQAVADAVIESLQDSVIIIFTPFIIMSEVMRIAVLQPIFTVDIEVMRPNLAVPSQPDL